VVYFHSVDIKAGGRSDHLCRGVCHSRDHADAMSDIVRSLVHKLEETQRLLVKILQEEYFCDDIEPPARAFGWSESDIRSFMESGGEVTPDAAPAAAPPVEVQPMESSAPAPEPTPAMLAPLPPLAPLADIGSDDGYSGRPIILCLGDAATEFGSHVVNQPTADVGGARHTLSAALDPVATEFLRGTETDNPGVEHGPGWITLLARDFAWRTAADVINRGYSGYNSAMLRADLPSILGPLRRQDICCVTLMLGANDCVADGERTHVPLASFRENVEEILSQLRRDLPNAKVILVSPAPLDEPKWRETAKRLTGGRKNGAERSASRHAEYSKAISETAAKSGAKFLDLQYKLKYEFANAMMELQNPAHDGLHLTRAVNIFLYRQLKNLMDDCGISASRMPRHWPPSLKHAYGSTLADDDGRMKKYIPKSKPRRADRGPDC
jgi:lysophospholipase L1-like esterase